MSKYHDDASFASDPGSIVLSLSMLRELQPEQSAWTPDEEIAEHLMLGDSRSAVVVSVDPLVVAAYTDELCCVALLEFPAWLVARHDLEVGSRLLTVNTYRWAGEAAADLLPGPDDTGSFVDFFPIIADFLSEDVERLVQRKREIDEAEWARAEQLGQVALRQGQPHRDGQPDQVLGSVVKRAMPKLILIGVAVLVGILGVLALVWWGADTLGFPAPVAVGAVFVVATTCILIARGFMPSSS